MTWVLGSAVPFGYGALVSDIRVSWPDGQSRDMLQKIYPVGSMLMAGFSGSVAIGFDLIYDMQHFFACPPEYVWFPRIAAWQWWRRARRIFSTAPRNLRDLGSAIVLVGVSPRPTGLIGHHAYCVKMESPHFHPRFSPTSRWVSIGSGATHETATYLANNFHDHFWASAQGEVGMGRGGTAFMTAIHVSNGLVSVPMSTVSEVIQVGTVFIDRHEIRTITGSTEIGAKPGEVRKIEHGLIATSWDEFKHQAQEIGLQAAGTVAVA